ncbi:MAG: hypothetical protein IJ958_02700 [Agathobacter sp.]|nr:hypothetical protein [Agathobacter sp.]
MNNVATANTNAVSKANEKATENVNTTVTEKNTGFDETAVVYEKTPATETTKSSTANKNAGIDREALIAQMKADTEARMNQLTSIVQEMMTGQGKAFSLATGNEDIWKFLASGEYTVTEAAKLQAQEDISENGYWGVEQTSDRILDFAKALAGGDVSKADELLDAFKKGYEQATGAWGKELPEISKQTYDAVEEKFEAWKKEGEKVTETAPQTPAPEEVVTDAIQG